ncbi:UDP-N-acetylglucosamine 1-carboxyvinyltransferase [Insulibacter thermoxylanivorax]|uniref:UDP-N-acetylglucosamine 1-carboxyvinyltransferase n=1 Tax=Insulibacter thermoxylanivorax TaxID=2749268 RepID=A0A916QE89_9BACL|nr:UDP-N-acetylglucosamine 1-carboxyvinyltransferase [Insulibacter thermoxylanivorax]GFR37473.1 UDP-N-acetylglucosamine 1-carboxyvinyltransferase [Insulibacter thermoxylanivorax]
MEKLVIEGGRPLQGTIEVHGSKNAALPILAASILAEGTHMINNVPNLLDIHVMLSILSALGCRTEMREERVIIDTSTVTTSQIPEDLMGQMRSSIFLMGPLLARFGRVTVTQPGGCAIGERKIDLHLRGLEALGANIQIQGGTIHCTADRLVGTEIFLDLPSVGATENILMAAVRAEGKTVIYNAAREPEIEDLQNYLNRMGARVSGAGTSTITVEGVEHLTPCQYTVIPDRIVSGTMMVAAAATRGDVVLEGVNPEHLTTITHVLRRAGVHIEVGDDIMKISCPTRTRAVERIVTQPYPAFPTDMQPQMMVLFSLSYGTSIIKETIFEGRFKHVDELNRMGADIRVDSHSAFVRGVPRLYGATVEATDLRAGAALVIAGLAASGTTIVEQVHHIDRGYERIEDMFARLGARIERYTSSPAAKRVSG